MTIYSQMPAGTSCWLAKEKPVKATKIVIVGSDLEAVYNGMLIYHYIKKVYDYSPTVYCCGGKHRFLPETQAKLCREVCIKLGISKGSIRMCEKGSNIQMTLSALFEEMYPKDEVVVYATAFRSHLLVKEIVAGYELLENAYFCAPANPVSKDFRDEIAYDLRWGNFMNLGNQTLLIHEMLEFYGSSLYFDQNVANPRLCNKLMARLRKRMACGRLEAYLRYVGFQLSYRMNKRKILQARDHQVSLYQKRLKEHGFNY